ncbi:ribosomal RNA-processing protein 7-domain-containing protein [Blastocladiella britannica]|nr:ribosomal RNA-processing protein 7-domain-containing protein [Blastocladiella britannica]
MSAQPPSTLPGGSFTIAVPATRASAVHLLNQQQHTVPVPTPHHLLYRRLPASINDLVLPVTKTVAVTNLPGDASPAQLQALFATVGAVDRVVMFNGLDAKTTRADATAATEARTEMLDATDTAYVVFKKPTALARIGTSVAAESWPVGKHVKRGLKHYMAAHDAHRPDRASVRDTATAIVAEYDARKAAEDTYERAKTVDADGFILVTRKRGGNALPSAARAKPTEAGMQRDFYRFQLREEKRSQLAAIREKFAMDKLKLEDMKKNRRFKPY